MLIFDEFMRQPKGIEEKKFETEMGNYITAQSLVVACSKRKNCSPREKKTYTQATIETFYIKARLDLLAQKLRLLSLVSQLPKFTTLRREFPAISHNQRT